MNQPDLDIEPEPGPITVAVAAEFVKPEFRLTLAPNDDAVAEPAHGLMHALPPDFPLATLLSFLPDVRLKQHAEDLAHQAIAVDVTADQGLAKADTALVAVRAAVQDIESRFKGPVDVANQLHKRLTGLRADFTVAGQEAISVVGRRLVQEQRRRDAEAAEVRRRLQDEADRQARDVARRAAEEAAKAQAPAPIVEALKAQAQVATAPPVAVQAPVPMARTSVVEKWKARLKGTPANAEPNPETDALSLAQQQQVRTLLRAVADGQVPLTAVEINWSYLNKRAAAEKSTLAIPEVEAYDEGGTRSKGGRR